MNLDQMFVDLLDTARECGDEIHPRERPALMTVADILSRSPKLAKAWARVLTEHTAPAVAAPVTFHPFVPASPHRIACAAPSATAGMCGERHDAPVHRVEKLTLQEHEALLNFLATGAVAEILYMATLFDLGFIARGQVTARGRAWLEAHPREGGESR